MRLLILALLLAATPAAAQNGAAPAAPPVEAPGAAPAASDAASYMVGVEDVLKITVFGEPELSNSYRVDADGTFNYPFLNKIKAAGRPLGDIEDEIATRLRNGYVRQAQVSVEVEQYRARSIFVVGEVRSPGKVPLTAQMTLLEALAQAGYTTANAGSQVLVIRSGTGGGGAAAGSAAESNNAIRANLADLQAGRMATNVVLQEGDTVLVPPAEKFYVTGHVRAPGAFTHEPGMTVLQAVSLAGGVSEKGSTRGIKIQRVVDGEKRELNVEMTDTVEANDTIIVRQRFL
ncbi:MAG: hypothetical protein FJW23_10415 [Acidimicrobiia bacterium]|nr:hypothetical protein [Acidimicrobiia bacterium]